MHVDWSIEYGTYSVDNDTYGDERVRRVRDNVPHRYHGEQDRAIRQPDVNQVNVQYVIVWGK